MGSLNVEEWTPEQVANWISGLSSPACSYSAHALAGGVSGKRLLLLGPDSLENIGVYPIGHQELILEAVERLREFHYECTSDCVSALALKLAAVAGALATSLLSCRRGERLDACALAATARTVRAAKTLAERLAAWRAPPPPLPTHPAEALLALALEAATSAQRDRFAEAPARGVAVCARSLCLAAECVLRDVHDPTSLQPAALLQVTLPPRKHAKVSWNAALDAVFEGWSESAKDRNVWKDLRETFAQQWDSIGISVRVGPGGSGALVARVAFGSSAAGALLPGDELIAVNSQVVVGWSALRVEALCRDSAQELNLRLRRHARPPPSLRRPRPRHLPPPLVELEGESSPLEHAGETALSSDESSAAAGRRARLYRPPPSGGGGGGLPRRHSVSGGSPPRRVEWLYSTTDTRQHASEHAIHTTTCASTHSTSRGRLDKSHSTPAYDRVEQGPGPYSIPDHTPTKSGGPQQWQTASSQLQWALTRRSPPAPHPAPAPAPHYPALKAVTGDRQGKRNERLPRPMVIAPPLAAVTVPAPVTASPPVTSPPPVTSAVTPEDRVDNIETALAAIDAPQTVSGGSCSLKKASAILSVGRAVSSRSLEALGGAAGPAWQRVRARTRPARWTRRHLQLAAHALYAFRRVQSARASLRIRLQGCTCAPATEVRSKQHAFKVYHTDRAVYFAADSRDAMLAWLHLITRATLQTIPTHPKLDPLTQFSETEYSDTESDTESAVSETSPGRPSTGAGSGATWRRLTGLARSESADSVRAAPSDTKYLRFFTRHRRNDKDKKSKQPVAAAVVPPPSRLSPVLPMPVDASRGRARAAAPTGFVTLEEFMLKEQQERKPVFSSPARETPSDSLARRLRRVVPDVVYGETPATAPPPQRAAPPAPPAVPARTSKPHSVTGRDGYEKLVYPDDEADDDAEAKRLGYEVVPALPTAVCVGSGAPPPLPTPPLAAGGWRDSLRKHRRVHTRPQPVPPPAPPTAPPAPPPKPKPIASWYAANESSARLTLVDGDTALHENVSSGQRTQYPHLQCPPRAETYSLPRAAPPPPRPV